MIRRDGGARQLDLPLGRLPFNSRPLRLRAVALTVVADHLPLGEARRYVALAAAADLTQGSLGRYVAIWRNFELFSKAVAGVEDAHDVDRDLATRFVRARTASGLPAPSTMSLRCSALRYFFRVLRGAGLLEADPTLDLAIPRPGTGGVHVLSDDEIGRCRWAAESALHAAPRYTAVLAAAEAGTSTGELGQLEWESVAANGADLRIEGERVSSPRTVHPTPWGAAALVAARREASGDRVAVLQASSYNSARTSVTHVLREIFDRAGVVAEPRSITAWTARRIFDETGQIDAAARAIGFESIDRTAELIGYDWRGVATP